MSPRTPKQFQEIREEKKALIMEVALHHFANEGYFKTSTSHIARHAGISKGLMYNYFASKEELLMAIMNKYLEEIMPFFDPDKDDYLSEEEFELFLRKFFSLLREKVNFWRLFSQLMLQKDVRDSFLKSENSHVTSEQVMHTNWNNAFLNKVTRLLKDYFIRKKERKPPDYDPTLDMLMFLYTIEGFSRITIYQDDVDEDYYRKTINKIIDLYK